MMYKIFYYLHEFYDVFTHCICHRIPERSFKIGNTYFPVCARCTGFYISAFSYFLYTYLFYVEYDLKLILLGFLLLIPAIMDGGSQFIGFRESNNVLRLITGIFGGLGLGILIKSLKFYLILIF